jgi:hypothetical protein
MKSNLISLLMDFINEEKIDLSLSEDSSSEFWLDDPQEYITVKFKVDIPKHEILYDVYSPEYSVHLKEETIKDVENLEFIAEENRRWRMAEIIEEIWLILDQIKLWAEQNNLLLMEKELI